MDALIPSYPQPAYWADSNLTFTEGWARKQSSLDGGKAAKEIPGLSSVVLPHNHWLYISLRRYVLRSLEAKKMHAPKGEDARMNHARTRIEEANKAKSQAEEQLANVQNELDRSKLDKKIKQQAAIILAADNRLREGVSGSGVMPPGYRSIAIRNIRLLKHAGNWNRYAHLRTVMYDRFSSAQMRPYQGHRKFNWCVTPRPAGSEHDIDRAPLLNADLGEALLFSGTSRDAVQRFIVKQGFDPLFPKPYNQKEVLEHGARARYGMIGQGTYFTDSFALAMCYSTCRICGDFECNCRGDSGRKTTRNVAITRVLLGNPKMYVTFWRKKIVDPVKRKFGFEGKKADEFRYIKAVENPDLYGEFLDEEFQTVFAQGMHGFTSLFKGGTTCNQQMIRHPAQAYLEFLVDFVIGFDSTTFSEALRRKLDEYTRKTSGVIGTLFTSQSEESLLAHFVLTKCLNAFDGVILLRQEVTENHLKEIVKYLLGTGPTPTYGTAELWAAVGRLNTKGRLAGLLRQVPGVG